MALKFARPLWFALGWLAVGLGALGVVLPVLPTTPFLLVAVWAFGKSSERWRQWVYRQPTFGPLVMAWERHGVIPLWGKGSALGAMSLSFGYLIYIDRLPTWALVLIGVTLLCVAGFIASRPSVPPAKPPPMPPQDIAP